MEEVMYIDLRPELIPFPMGQVLKENKFLHLGLLLQQVPQPTDVLFLLLLLLVPVQLLIA